MNWPLLVFLAIFGCIVFIVAIVGTYRELNNGDKDESAFTTFGDDPWPHNSWPFV